MGCVHLEGPVTPTAHNGRESWRTIYILDSDPQEAFYAQLDWWDINGSGYTAYAELVFAAEGKGVSGWKGKRSRLFQTNDQRPGNPWEMWGTWAGLHVCIANCRPRGRRIEERSSSKTREIKRPHVVCWSPWLSHILQEKKNPAVINWHWDLHS